MVIGPEAGLSEFERKDLATAGVAPASFAPHNLRIETAAIAAAVVAFAGRSTGARTDTGTGTGEGA